MAGAGFGLVLVPLVVLYYAPLCDKRGAFLMKNIFFANVCFI
jgi:hypothetical protein